MHFFQILNEELGCASYLIADDGEAVVVDPRWDVAVYGELAQRAGARITHALDTHDHADHVSGRGRLARLTGAIAVRPGDGLAAGDVLRVGNVRLEVLPAAGHRPEHIALAVFDEGRSDVSWMLLSGDSLLVGDVARPDLAVDPQEGARELHATLERLFALGDHVELWPGHVGGSLCGSGKLSPRTSSTVGYERRSSSPASLAREPFVTTLTSGAPPQPPNVERIVGLNQGALDAEPADPPEIDLAQAADATVIDVRPPAAFDAAHLRGALSLPPGPGWVTRTGWAVSPGEPLVVIAGDAGKALTVARTLHGVGLWNIAGVAAADPEGWRSKGLTVDQAEAWDLDRLATALGENAVELVDVRDPAEWAAGHVPGSHPLPLSTLGDGRTPVADLNGGTIAVACALGGRAALAASLLRRAGHPDVVRVGGGGIPDLARRGMALER